MTAAALEGTLHRRLLLILHRGLVEIRNLALAKENTSRIADLSDTLELLPSLMDQWEDGHMDLVRRLLADYQTKHPDATFDYLSILDATDGVFERVYGKW
jgi:hypothetical protein